MIIAESTVERKLAKRKLRKQLNNYGITIKDVQAKLKDQQEISFHYNTVRDALNGETKYWNQEVINLAEQMIEEKKALSTTTTL